MRTNQRRRRVGAPSGPRLAQGLRNAYAIALARALCLACSFSPNGSTRFSFALLYGTLTSAVDGRGNPFIAAPHGIEGRAAGIARRKRRRDDRWLAESVAELAVWLTCRKAGGAPDACAAGAMVALAKLDAGWAAILERLEKTLTEIRPSRARPFELCRLPPAALELVNALCKRRT